MNQQIDYTKLTIQELKKLTKKNDDNAINEYLKRVNSGDIKPKTYTVEELEKIYAEKGFI